METRGHIPVWAFRHNWPARPDRHDRVYLTRGRLSAYQNRDGAVKWESSDSSIVYWNPAIRERFFPALAPGDVRRVNMRRLAPMEPPSKPGRSIVGVGYAAMDTCGSFIFGVDECLLELIDHPGRCMCNGGYGYNVCHGDIQSNFGPEVLQYIRSRNQTTPEGARAVAFRLEVTEVDDSATLKSRTKVRKLDPAWINSQLERELTPGFHPFRKMVESHYPDLRCATCGGDHNRHAHPVMTALAKVTR
jgi:hypothetical protein